MADLDDAKDPFAPVPEENLPAPKQTFQKVDHRGHVIEYKVESGVEVALRDLGHIKEQFNQAIWKAAMRNSGEPLSQEELAEIRNVDMAAIMLARRAAVGDMDAINALFDRVLGKPKQTMESSHVNLNIDAILTGQGEEQDKGPKTIEVQPDG